MRYSPRGRQNEYETQTFCYRSIISRIRNLALMTKRKLYISTMIQYARVEMMNDQDTTNLMNNWYTIDTWSTPDRHLIDTWPIRDRYEILSKTIPSKLWRQEFTNCEFECTVPNKRTRRSTANILKTIECTIEQIQELSSLEFEATVIHVPYSHPINLLAKLNLPQECWMQQ